MFRDCPRSRVRNLILDITGPPCRVFEGGAYLLKRAPRPVLARARTSMNIPPSKNPVCTGAATNLARRVRWRVNGPIQPQQPTLQFRFGWHKSPSPARPILSAPTTCAEGYTIIPPIERRFGNPVRDWQEGDNLPLPSLSTFPPLIVLDWQTHKRRTTHIQGHRSMELVHLFLHIVRRYCINVRRRIVFSEPGVCPGVRDHVRPISFWTQVAGSVGSGHAGRREV